MCLTPRQAPDVHQTLTPAQPPAQPFSRKLMRRDMTLCLVPLLMAVVHSQGPQPVIQLFNYCQKYDTRSHPKPKYFTCDQQFYSSGHIDTAELRRDHGAATLSQSSHWEVVLSKIRRSMYGIFPPLMAAIGKCRFGKCAYVNNYRYDLRDLGHSSSIFLGVRVDPGLFE